MKTFLAKLLLAVGLLAAPVLAQVPVIGNPIDRGPNLPTICKTGQDWFFKTSAADGNGNIGMYWCSNPVGTYPSNWASAGSSGIGSLGGADVIKVSKSGSAISYFASNYSNSAVTAFLTACGAVADGDNIYLAGETFDFGTGSALTCDLSLGGTITANLHGAGPLTLIKRGFNGTAPIIGPGLNHSRITDLNITSYITPGSSSFEISIENRLANASWYDVVDLGIERVNIVGVSDCVIINPTVASSGYSRNYTCATQWDGMTQTGNGGVLTWTMENTQTTVTPDATNTTGTCYKMSETTGGTIFNLDGPNKCTMINTNPAANLRGLDTEGSGAGPVVINVGPGFKVDSSAVTSYNIVADINLGLPGTTLNLNSSAVYNPSRFRQNNQTVNFCQDLFSCPAQITGGIVGSSGSSASTWSNVALAPFGDSAATSVFAAAPFSFFLVNPTLTTSNTNGSAGLQVQLDTNLGATPTRVQWIMGIPPGAVAGVYRNTSLPPYQIAAGQPFSNIGVNSIPTNGTALATVRGLTYNLVGTNNTMLGAYVGATVPASGTRFVGFSNTLQSTETLTQTVMATAYSISGFCAYASAGAAGSTVITLRKAAADTTLILTIPTAGTAGVWCITGTAITGAAGDLLDWKIVNNDVSNPTGTIVNLIAQDTPTLPATGQLTFGLGSSTLTSNQNNYSPPFSGIATSITQLNNQVGLPRAIVVPKLSCRAFTCPGTNDATFTVQKNGVSTSLAVTVLHTDTCPETVTDTTAAHAVAFAAGDLINLIENQPTSGTAPVVSSCSVEHD